ncbi:hypothetical protein [Thioalkalivibrio sp. XN279]|uniref:hypothetical protein n=1 Tax=Thioalkalivibrio sp. XN279 TaxID=2714953 RepID=UPI0014087CD0|nr:hypothetical protein [Thioalkalivibrio sp. XN279]NHA14481.1 hypothetical protein [Thioalkalivibrio sp. XN279]
MTLVALLAASVYSLARTPDAPDPLAISAQGIGPLQIGRPYDEAAELAVRVAPDNALAGIGCGGLDEVRYSGQLQGRPVSAMGMADKGKLVEIELTLDAPLQARSEAACVALRDEFAAPFVARFGPVEKSWEERKPVSREHLAATGPVVLAARWFATGGSCYVSAHYGYGASLSAADAAW